MRILIGIFLILLIHSGSAQEPNRWSDYEDFGFNEDYFIQHSYKGVEYLISHNLNDKIEIRLIKNGALQQAYLSSFLLCEEDYFEWHIYRDKIIYLGPRGYRIDNFLTGTSTYGALPDVPDFQLSLIFGFQYVEGTVHFTISADSAFALDLPSEQIIPPIVGEIVFRTESHVFYTTGLLSDRQLLRRPIASAEVDTVKSSFSVWRVREDVGAFYIHFKEDALIRVDGETASLDTLAFLEGTLLEVYSGNQDSLFVFTKVGDEIIQTLLLDHQIVKQESMQSGIGVNLSLACDEKYLYINQRVGAKKDVWAIDYRLDQAYEIVQGVDNESIFIEQDFALLRYAGNGTGSVRLFQKNRKGVQVLDLGFEDLLFQLEDMLWRSENGTPYILYYNAVNGYQAQQFDVIDGTWASSPLYLNDAYGLGLNYTWTGSSAYFEKLDRGHLVQIKESEPHQVIIEMEEPAFPIYYHNGNAYFITAEDWGSDSLTYIIWEKAEEALEANIAFPAVAPVEGDEDLDYRTFGRHMVVSQDGVHMAYDLESGNYYELSDEAQLLFEFSRLELENYYLVDIKVAGAPGRLVLQSKEDLNSFIDIDSKSPKYIAIEGDAFVYFTVDDFFYYDGIEAHLLARSEEEVSIHEVVISPDKRYIAYRSTVEGERVMNVYHRESKTKKTYPLSGLNWIEIYDDNVLIYTFFGNRYEIMLYDFNSAFAQKLEFDQRPILLSAFGNEFHFYDRALMEIMVYDQTFDLQSRHYNTDLIDFILVPVEERRDINPLIHTAYKNRNLILNSIVRSDAQVKLYDPVSKTVQTFFECGADGSLVEVIIGGRHTFILAGTLDRGYQMYALSVEDYILNKGVTTYEKDVTIFPNPTNDQINFSVSLQDPVIYNLYGQRIKQWIGDFTQVNLEDIDAGIYFIHSIDLPSGIKFIKVD